MSLFPTPIYTCEVEIEEEERLFLLNQYPDNIIKNKGNFLSKDFDILKNIEVQALNKKLLYLVNDAFNCIHRPRNDTKLYITQSWLNFSVKGQYHHQHSHTNSFFSAVLYLNTTERDSIIFLNPKGYGGYDVESLNCGIFNSSLWKIPVKDNLLLIFPSAIEHTVPVVEHDNLRVSLSFNTFLKGKLGAPDGLNYLVL